MIPLYYKVACTLFLIGLIIILGVVSLGIDWVFFHLGSVFTTIALGMLIGGYISEREQKKFKVKLVFNKF